MAVVDASPDQSLHLLKRSDDLFGQAFHVHALLDIFSDIEVHGGWLKQIDDLLVVDLKVAALDEGVELGAICLLLDYLFLTVKAAKNIFERSLDDAFALFRLLLQ